MPVSKKARVSDQYDLEARLEKIIHFHLMDMEENPEMYAAKDRLSTIQYVGMWLNRKYGWGEDEHVNAGAAVRKYSGAFRVSKPEAARSRPTRVTSGLAAVDDSEDDAD